MSKVLIVEDSASQAAIISELVASAGHDPIIATDFSKGLVQTILPMEPEIVLLDLVLQGPDGKQVGDGFHLCREIKRVSKNKIKVIVVSAKGDEESEEWAVLQGADAYLQKPFAVEDLIEVMDQVLKR